MVEDIKKEKKEIKQEERSKPSTFGKWKKLAVGGLLGLSMLMPMKKAEGYIFDNVRGPPKGEYSEQLNLKYPEGWNLITSINALEVKQKSASDLTSKSLEYFKVKYNKTKDDDALYLLAYSHYQRAIDSKDILEAELHFQKSFELCEKKTKFKNTKLFLLDLKIIMSFNLGQAFWKEYQLSNQEGYKTKTKTYLEQGIETYNEHKNRIYFEKDQEMLENTYIQPAKKLLAIIE